MSEIVSPIVSVHEGITHVEDLPVDEMIAALRNFEQYEISEKVDGSNLWFGVDEIGFYTSRENKGSEELIRDESSYGIAFNTTFMRAAHVAISKVVPSLLKAGAMSVGDAVEVEVLFGRLPNTVTYSAETNRVIFLRPTKGNPDIDAIQNLTNGKRTRATLEAPYTLDGSTIKTTKEIFWWEFAKTPTVSGSSITSNEKITTELNAALDALESFMKGSSGIGEFTNAQVISMPLNTRPEGLSVAEWKNTKVVVKEKRAELNELLYSSDNRSGFKHKIKEILLTKLVRQTQSEFGPSIEDGGWIEGLVVRHPKTGDMFKIVDKDLFTAANKFVWQVRYDIGKPAASVSSAESFIGKMMIDLASTVGHPDLGTNQAKRYLSKHGTTPEEILTSLSANVDATEAKAELIVKLGRYKKQLEGLLNDYKREYKNLSLDIEDRKFEYNDDVHSRTLQSFAELNSRIDDFTRDARNAKTTSDLIMLLVGKKLSGL
jgi:hypothetical protein